MQVNKTIAFCLENYNGISAAVTEARLDPNIPKQGGGGHCRISDPTAMLAIRNAQEVRCVRIFHGASIAGRQECTTVYYPERWLRVVEKTLSRYNGNVYGELIRLKFREGMSRDEILARVNVGRTLYHVMLSTVFTYAEGVAAGMGLDSKVMS